jgi:hypothetical protein
LLFVTKEAMGPVLFSLALFARALIAAVAAHWASIGVLFLMGDDLDNVVPTTRIVVILLAVTVLASIMSIRRRQPGGKERIAAGPRMVAQWRPLVLAIGGASGFGGLLIFVSGYQSAGGWAMGIGTAMVVFEVAAIVGAAVRESSDSQMHE